MLGKSFCALSQYSVGSACGTTGIAKYWLSSLLSAVPAAVEVKVAKMLLLRGFWSAQITESCDLFK